MQRKATFQRDFYKSDIIKLIQIGNLLEYEKNAKYSEPVEIGCFSFDESREFKFGDRSTLGNYKQPNLPLDLNQGYPEKYVQRNQESEHLDYLLKSFQKINKERIKQGKDEHKPDFVTWRGIMTKIWSAPYSRDAWELGATLHKGTIYIEEHEDPNRDKYGEDEKQRLFTYYGYKFEHEVVDNTNQTKDSAEVNTNVQFCSVFSTKLNNHRLILGGEVDCLYSKPLSEPRYAELKTNRVITTKNQEQNLIRYKLLKTWIQSYLAGVRHVIFGFRDDGGFLQQIKVYETSDFPRMARKDNFWNPFVCMTFCDIVLTELKKVVVKDDCNVVYTIRFNPYKKQIEIYAPNEEDTFVKEFL